MPATSRHLLLIAVIGMVAWFARPTFGQPGVPLWTNHLVSAGGYDDLARSMAVDGQGNVFVTGCSLMSSFSTADYLTVGYSSTGPPLWTNRYDAGDEDVAADMAVDADSNVVVTGSSAGSGSGTDFATVKYSSAGAALWPNRYDGPAAGSDEAYAVATDKYGSVYVAGTSPGGDGSFDYAAIKYATVNAAPIPLQILRVGSGRALTWGDARFALQSAPAVTGNFTNVSGATSPYTNSGATAQQFFRLKANCVTPRLIQVEPEFGAPQF